MMGIELRQITSPDATARRKSKMGRFAVRVTLDDLIDTHAASQALETASVFHSDASCEVPKITRAS